VNREEVTAALAARLVADQFPQWGDLPLTPVKLNGWDNTTFRLGGGLSIRLPTGEGYAAQVEKEHRWLPVLAAQLPLSVPVPVALGRPNAEFPWPWSIYRWIDGEPSSVGEIADRRQFAADLADLLTALHRCDAADGPPPGRHSQGRGGSPERWDADVRTSLDLLAGAIDVDGANEVWESSLGRRWLGPPVWVHGDVTGSNLLVKNGRLCAVIDFGCSAVGDPAGDLVMAWTFFDPAEAAVFRRSVPVDEGTWARARGWALWKALVTLADAGSGGPSGEAAVRQFGWRHDPSQIVDLVIADHRRTA
jgi:aminoglycoside phosphotransferase (APT) family kinase protein